MFPILKCIKDYTTFFIIQMFGNYHRRNCLIRMKTLQEMIICHRCISLFIVIARADLDGCDQLRLKNKKCLASLIT